MAELEFVAKVAERAGVPAETAQCLTEATLRTLAERISGGEAADLARHLPPDLQPHLTGAPEPAERFTPDEFVRRVAERAGTDEDHATKGIRAVFDTLREVAPGKELDEVTTQLPKEFGALVGSRR